MATRALRLPLLGALLCCEPARALWVREPVPLHAGCSVRHTGRGCVARPAPTGWGVPLAPGREAARAGATWVLRLRGAGDMSDAPVVDTRPAPFQPSDRFEQERVCVAGEQALAAAEQALADGEFERARRLQQDATREFTRHLSIATWYDTLWGLHDRIDQAEKDLEAALDVSNAVPPPYWSVSAHLNLTSEQVGAIEEWTGRPLQADRVLYLASEHGFDSRAFHHRCDNKGATVTLVRTATGHIFGGYSSVPWSRGELKTKPPRWVPTYVQDPQAFVFRLCAPANWTGRGYDEVFGANYTEDMVLPYYSFRRNEERRAQRIWAAGSAVNATKEAKEALADSVYENYTEGMFWSKFDEDEAMGAPDVWSKERAMTDDEEEGAPQRWGLDVKVQGISNSTNSAMTDDQDSRAEGGGGEAEGGGGAAAHGASAGPGAADQAQPPEEWRPPVRLTQARARGLGDIPPLRHLWNKGPSFTHALELDLDVPENSFSDLLSGYIFGMPPGVPDEEERLFLAGKIGGRLFVER